VNNSPLFAYRHRLRRDIYIRDKSSRISLNRQTSKHHCQHRQRCHFHMPDHVTPPGELPRGTEMPPEIKYSLKLHLGKTRKILENSKNAANAPISCFIAPACVGRLRHLATQH